MNMSTKANFSVHCSIPVPARNPGASCFCVELQFLYMVNVLSKSKPGHGRETTARRQHCSRKSSWPQTRTTTAADARGQVSRFQVGLHRLGHRRHRRASLRHACIRSLLRNIEASLLGERRHCLDTILLNLRHTGAELLVLLRKKHIGTTRSVAKARASSAAPLWSLCIIQPKNPPTLTNVGKKRSSSVSPPTVSN